MGLGMCTDETQAVQYNPETGLFTRLKKAGRSHAGTIVSTPHSEGYVRVKIERRHYFAHRLAWKIMTGQWPTYHIDHVNGDRADNRWCNLREATPSQNQQNKKRQSNNSSGMTGVYWDASASRWRAQISINKTRKKLGSFSTPEAAHAAYVKAVKDHFGEFRRLGV